MWELNVWFLNKLPSCIPTWQYNFTFQPAMDEWSIFSTYFQAFGIIIFYFIHSDRCVFRPFILKIIINMLVLKSAILLFAFSPFLFFPLFSLHAFLWVTWKKNLEFHLDLFIEVFKKCILLYNYCSFCSEFYNIHMWLIRVYWYQYFNT